MKTRPILFSGAMVRAILDGSKTQTRRVVKMPHHMQIEERDDGTQWPWMYDDAHTSDYWMPCPYGKVGDQLWVRETYQAFFEDEMPADRPKGPQHTMGQPANKDRKSFAYYRADGEGVRNVYGEPNWRPSIHMPRKYSRIQLEITGVRVERLNDISEQDAIAEGLKGITKDGNLIKYGIPDADGYPGTDDIGCPWENWRANPADAYRRLWESINGAGSWNANPWVWVIEFRMVAA
ncbi:MAG: hypothetical protein Q7U37_03135 [Gallionella sp.]|nr:hypothetical protein [Gallionella sp.]